MNRDDDGRHPDHDYKIGYRRPPEHSRFGRGRSGNSKGRPPGAKGALTILRRELLAPALVKQHGLQVKTTKLQAIAAQLVNQAVRGHYPSIRTLFKYLKLDQILSQPSRERRGLSPAGKDLIMRALCGNQYAPKTIPPLTTDHRAAISSPRHDADQNPKSDSNQREESDAIGYCRPPVHTRWQKGHSGNLGGRPRVSKGFRTSVHRLLEEQVTITENGCAQRYTRLELIFMQIVNKAASGDLRFQNLLLEHAPTLDMELDDKREFSTDMVERIRKRLLDGLLGREISAPTGINNSTIDDGGTTESVSDSSPAETGLAPVPVPEPLATQTSADHPQSKPQIFDPGIAPSRQTKEGTQNDDQR